MNNHEQNKFAADSQTATFALFSLDDLKAALPQAIFRPNFEDSEKGALIGAIKGSITGSISTDSRTLSAGQWYLSLKGERFDGHQYIAAAIARGAAGCIISDLAAIDEKTVSVKDDVIFVCVEDTLRAYQNLATYYLQKIAPVVVAITGSSGKTTTKEMAAAVFAQSFKIHKSAANENNEIGLPKTILNMPTDTQVLVAEMGMRGLGQIDELASIAKPNIAIITNAGTAHIELLGSKENIARAKCEILTHLNPSDGLGIIGSPSDLLVRRAQEVFDGTILLCKAADIQELAVSFATTEFTISEINQIFVIHAHGLAHLQDAWCAIMAAQKLGMSVSEIAAGLFNYHSIDGRGNCLSTDDGALIIDESYNANPDSMRCAITGMLDERVFPHKNKIIVLGDMGELGEHSDDLHFDLGQWLKDKSIKMLVTVGHQSKHIADGASGSDFLIKHLKNNEEVARFLRPELNRDSCVIIKGSHSANLESVVADLVSPASNGKEN